MKTRKQKVIFRIFCTIVSILLLASFFAVPVSADDGKYFLFKPSFDFDGGNASYLYRFSRNVDYLDQLDGTNHFMYQRLIPTDYDIDYAMFEFTVPETNGETGDAQFVYPMGQSYFSGNEDVVQVADVDTLFLEEGRFYLEFETELDAFVKARFTLRGVENFGGTQDVFDIVYAKTDIFDIYVSEGTKPYFDYDRLEFEVLESFETPVFLCLELQFTTAYALELKILYIDENDGKVFFGGGSSPNNPVFPSAPGKDDVDGLGSAEHELIQSQQQGINAGLNVMGDTSSVLTDLNTSLQLGAFATQLSGILDKIVTIPGIDALVQVSLALGLFASLMALSASIISAADRKAGKDARDTKQQERARTKSTHRRMGDF